MKAIVFPFGRVIINILPDIQIILFTADHMIVIRTLEVFIFNITVYEAFQC